MSTIVGQAPIMKSMATTASSSLATSDAVAVNHLLNNTSSSEWNNYTNLTTANYAGLVLSTPANKSLYLFQNLNATAIDNNATLANITSTGASFDDRFGYDLTGSNVLLGEDLRFNLYTPDRLSANPTTGVPVIYSENSTSAAQIVLKEVAPQSQGDVTALNNLRILNQSGAISAGYSLNYSASNLANALGVEGKAFYYNNTNGSLSNYKNYSGYETLAANNITLTIDNLTTSNSYTYEVVRISAGDSLFNLSSSQAGSSVVARNVAGALVSIDANATLSYTGLLGSVNYSGTMGSNYGQVYSSNLTLSLSNGANVTQGLSSNSSLLIVNPTFVAMNNVTSLALAQSLVVANSINVTLSAYSVNWTNSTSSLPSGALTLVQAVESLPVGHELDNATLSFNSTNRSTIVNLNSSNYNLSASIVYAADNVSGASLSSANMQTLNVNYTLKMTSADTLNNLVNYNSQPVQNQWTNCSGINFFVNASTFNNTAVSSSTCSNVSGLSFIGVIQQTQQCNWNLNSTNNYTGSQLLAVTGSNPNFNLELNAFYANLTGASITGSYLCDYIRTNIPNIDPSQQRIHFTPCDPLSLNVTMSDPLIVDTLNISGMSLTSAVSLTKAGPVINYNSDSLTGPISFKDYPNTTFYHQRYEMLFPETGEINANTSDPEKIVITAWDDNGVQLRSSLTGNLGSVTVLLDASNWSSRSVSTDIVNGTTTVSGTISIDVGLSGIVPGSIDLDIPISYTYNSRARTWQNGVPNLVIDVKFNKNNLLTHYMTLEGFNTVTQSWVNYANPPSLAPSQPPFDYVDLRRSPYDACFFSYSIGNIQQYNAVLSFYPQLSQNFSSIDYYIPLVEVTDESSGGATAQIAIIDNNQTLIDSIGALGFKGLSRDQVATLVNNTTLTSMNVVRTSPSSPEYPKTLSISSGNISFSYTIADGAYFGPSTQSYFINLAKPVIRVESSSSTSYQMMANNVSYSIDDGVNVQSANFVRSNNSGAVNVNGQPIASVSLNADKYSISVYGNAANPAANSDVVPILVSGSENSPSVTFGLNSSIYRGFKNGDVYTIARSGLTYGASFGSYSQSGSLTPAGASPTDLVLDFNGSGHSFGWKLQLVGNSLSAQNVTLTVNKTNIAANWLSQSTTSGILYQSLQLSSVLSALNTLAPWYELLFLKNVFVPGSNNAVVNYAQPNVLIEAFANPTGYYCTNDSTPAATFLNALSGPTSSQSNSDADIIAASYVLNQDQVHLTYSASNMNRPVGKTYYVTVAPVDLTIKHHTGVSNASISGIVLLDAQSKGYSVSGANYNIELLNGLLVSSLKASPPAGKNLIYKPNLFKLQGSLTGQNNWYDYFSGVDITTLPSDSTFTWSLKTILGQTVYAVEFVQNGSAYPDKLSMYWNDAFYRPVYDNNGFNYAASNGAHVSVLPNSVSVMKQYELGFTYNSSNILVPVVTKYVSALYDMSINLTAAASRNGWIKTVPIQSGAYLFLNEDATSVIDPTTQGFPYEYNTANNYPLLNNNSVSIISQSSITGSSLPSSMDFVLQVKNNANATGSLAFYNYINVSAGDINTVKVLNVFGKDQLVVKDYADNLSLRVGPNGKVYAGDLSSYSLNVNQSNLTGGVVNGNYLQIYNSDVNLQ